MSIKCPVCKSPENRKIGQHRQYTLNHCSTCDLVFCDPMQSDPSYYENNADYLFRDSLIKDPIKWDYRWDMLEFISNPPRKNGTLLDIGCGTGYFVKAAENMGFSAQGMETLQRSIETGRRFFNLDTIYATDLQGYMKMFPQQRFDVVTLFQVLEHVEDPGQLMDEIKQVMDEDSVLVIAVPLRGRWPDTSGEDGDCPPHHLTRWTLRSLDNLLSAHGMKIKRHMVERFPLRNMPTLIYSYVLKLAPLLTMKGKDRSDDRKAAGQDKASAPELTDEQALNILKKRKLKMTLATIAGFPVWLILKMLGARGPNIYLEAVKAGKE